MGRPGYHWPNGVEVDRASRARFLAGEFPNGVVLSTCAPDDVLWVVAHSRLAVVRIYESAGDLAAPADVAARHVPLIQQVGSSGYFQLLNEPDREYASRSPESFATWWDACVGFIHASCPKALLGFPAPTVGGPADYLPRVAAVGGLRRAGFIAERAYWQGSGAAARAAMIDDRFGRVWRRSLGCGLPLVLCEVGNSDGAVSGNEKAVEYVQFAADLPRFVVAAGSFIGAGGDPHWGTVAGGSMWITDEMAASIGADGGVRVIDPVVVERVLRYKTLIQEYAAKERLASSLVAGLIAVESGGDAEATSPDNGPGLGHALGLMQVLESAFSAGENGHEPETNIRVGTAILRAKIDAFGGRIESGLAAYFGAVDASGNPTSGTDLTGTTGIRYVAEVESAAASFTDLNSTSEAVAANVPATTGNTAAPADADFLAYAPKSGTWREAAINLKGIADDALEAGRKMVREVAAGWAGR